MIDKERWKPITNGIQFRFMRTDIRNGWAFMDIMHNGKLVAEMKEDGFNVFGKEYRIEFDSQDRLRILEEVK